MTWTGTRHAQVQVARVSLRTSPTSASTARSAAAQTSLARPHWPNAPLQPSVAYELLERVGQYAATAGTFTDGAGRTHNGRAASEPCSNTGPRRTMTSMSATAILSA